MEEQVESVTSEESQLTPAQREATKRAFDQALQAKKEKERILSNEAPTEKFEMCIESTPTSRRIRIYDGAMKLRGDFKAVPHLTRHFRGAMSIMVKAKIIDGQFELIKVL